MERGKEPSTPVETSRFFPALLGVLVSSAVVIFGWLASSKSSRGAPARQPANPAEAQTSADKDRDVSQPEANLTSRFLAEQKILVVKTRDHDSKGKTRRRRMRRFRKAGVFWIGLGTFIVVLSYTRISYYQWDTARRQLEVMREAQRPWLGMAGQLTMTAPPIFKIPQKDVISLHLEGTYVVKNFGTAPAFNQNSAVVVEIPRLGDTTTRPDISPMTCPPDTKPGEVIFPSSGITEWYGPEIYLAKSKLTEVRRVWLLGCVTYHDRERNLHHTKFWLRSTFPDNAEWITINNGSFRYMPITSFESWGEEAD